MQLGKRGEIRKWSEQRRVKVQQLWEERCGMENGRRDGGKEEVMEGGRNREMEGWMEGIMEGRMEKWMEGMRDGWMMNEGMEKVMERGRDG